MSIELPYVVRLYWENGRGVARLHGVQRALEAAPAIEGLPAYDMVDYIPKTVAMIRPVAFGVRDLDRHECSCIERWLEKMRGLW